jgi:glycerol-3-phosphate acyltransferase PlsY
MIAVTRLMALVIGYFLGCFPTGYLVGKSRGVDIRKHGSGNTGATNTLRTLGWGAAVLTFLGDCAKTILAIVLANVLFKRTGFDMTILELYAGLGAVMGHNFPFYFKFKGGKGIACTAGLAFTLFPGAVPVCLTVFVLCIALSKYVSLGSIMMAILLVLQIFVFNAYGILGVPETSVLEFDILVLILGVLAIFQHRSNIVRLFKGTENKLGQKVEIKKECEK